MYNHTQGRLHALRVTGFITKTAVSWPFLNKVIERNAPSVAIPRLEAFVARMRAGQGRAATALDNFPHGGKTSPELRDLARRTTNYGAAANTAQEYLPLPKIEV